VPEPGKAKPAGKIEAVRGTVDLLPAESARWFEAEKIARDLFSRYGLGEVRTPVFEHVELFRRPLGAGSDVVEKEMYEFTDKGGRKLALRPEGTACVARAFIEHGLYAKGGPMRYFYIGPIFRYDRPQAGRYRQHHQIGVEVFGNPAPSQDAELIELGAEMLAALKVPGFDLKINSNGCPKCRPGYDQKLREHLVPIKGMLCEDCAGFRLERNILRVLDCKVGECRRATAEAPDIRDSLCDECARHFGEVAAHLKSAGINAVREPRLVRGFDYYTRTTFEFIGRRVEGRTTLLGGGRYDGLVDLLGGPDTPAVGWGMGIERVMEESLLVAVESVPAVFVVCASDQAFGPAMKVCRKLRNGGFACEMAAEGKSFRSQLRAANASKAPWALLAGLDEAPLVLKDLRSGAQEPVEESDIERRISRPPEVS